MTVVFFGDSANEFSNRHFAALEGCCCGPGSPWRIAGVVDCPRTGWVSTREGGREGSAPFDRRARELGLPVLSSRGSGAPLEAAELGRLEPELLVAVGYTRRLPPQLLEVPAAGAVNFHASLLPAYRGKHPLFWALRHDEPVAGLTVHLMSPQIDAGDILYQVRVRTRLEDSVADLYERVMEKSVTLIPRLLEDARRGPLRGRPQGTAGSSRFSSPREEDYHLRFGMPARRVVRWAAASPGRCFFRLGARRVFVLQAALGLHRGAQDRPGTQPPGTLLRLGRRHALVAAGAGSVRLQRLRLDNGLEGPAAQLLAALEVPAGARIEES